ncbi:MAG: hypothetical protein H7210_12295 [Pyrinomonadaceae bacterium]|nr:hypothetical protein [Phycisphaerales bacterium]
MKPALLFLAMLLMSIGAFAHSATAQCLNFGPVGAPHMNGVNGTVRAIAARQEGASHVVYVGGNFATVGGSVQARGIARWNGFSWSPVGNLGQFSGEVRTIAFFNSELYIGGQFTISSEGSPFLRGLAKWNGNAWVAVGGQANASAVNALLVHNGSLYVGGNGLGIVLPGGPSIQTIARWDGLSWNALPLTTQVSVSGDVQCMTTHDDGAGPTLFIGGNFSINGPNVSARNVARFEAGTFSALTVGIQSGFVYALASYTDSTGPALYVGGDFVDAGGVGNVGRIAKWQNGGWSALGSGIVGSSVRALTPYAGKLLVGGQFSRAGPLAASSLAAWDGTDWSPVGDGAPPAVFTISALEDGTGQHVFVGGQFSRIHQSLVNNFARSIPTAPTVVPAARTLRPSDVAVFTATPAGDGPFSYRWQHNGVTLAEGGRYFGTSTPTLLIGPLATPGSDPAWTDAGQYTVIVTGACGSASATATLTVEPCAADFNTDGFVNSQDFFDFLSTFLTGCP